MVPKRRNLNPSAQCIAEREALKRLYPQGGWRKISPISFDWEMDIIPTPLSNKYRVKIRYKYGSDPKVYVIDPDPLDLFPGKDKLPHVYSHRQQQICLYYPKAKEWSKDKLLARTIVPWASEWLQFYELWLATGVWLGEGIHLGDSRTKKENSDE